MFANWLNRLCALCGESRKPQGLISWDHAWYELVVMVVNNNSYIKIGMSKASAILPSPLIISSIQTMACNSRQIIILTQILNSVPCLR